MLSSARIQQRLAQRSIALVLAGGRGSRLKQLTDRRAKPAVFFGGKFRIIDFALSNCLNSGVRRIGVLSQYKAHSLLRHLQMGWSFLRPEMNEFLDLLPAQQRLDEATWYRGTADAVYQNFDIFRAAGPQYFIVLAGDHIYKMDYSNMLADHIDKGADCTVACIEVPIEQASDFGIMAVDDSMAIVDFLEKPKNPPAMAGQTRPRARQHGRLRLHRRVPLCRTRTRSPARGFEPRFRQRRHSRTWSAAASRSPIPSRRVASRRHPKPRPIGATSAPSTPIGRPISISSCPTPSLDIYDPNWPIWTYQQQLPPAKFVFDDDDRRGMAVDSMVSGGCIISGATVRRSLLFSNCRVNSLCPDLRGGVASRTSWSGATRGSTKWSSIAVAASRRGW